jgi:hypothetical protein
MPGGVDPSRSKTPDNGSIETEQVSQRSRQLNCSLSNIIQQTKRSVSPDPSESDAYEMTDECSIPYCPVHGILATNNREARRQLFRSKSIVIDGSDGGNETSSADNRDDGENENRAFGLRGRSVSDGHLLRPICIKDAQRRRMRELNRKSTDDVVQQSVKKMDEVRDEFRRRYSAPPRVKIPI